MTDEIVIFLSIRVEDMPNPADGSTKTPCRMCGYDVWVSPASMAFMESAAQVVCSRCSDPSDIPMDQIVPLSPAGQAEVVAARPGPRRKLICRLCGDEVSDELFVLREHIMGHRPEAGTLAFWSIDEEFRRE